MRMMWTLDTGHDDRPVHVGELDGRKVVRKTYVADADTGLTLYNLFDTELYNGQLQGNDYVFCRRWTDLGGEIWIDTVPMMEHVGTFTWAGSLARDLAPAQAAE